MADLFISYASQDRAAAAELASALESRGWSVWWDRALKGGDRFASVIEHELDIAAGVIVLWSRWAQQSGWVLAEGQRAFDADKVVPVRLDDQPPALPLSLIQAPDLSRWRGSPIDPALEEVFAALESRLDRSIHLERAPCPLFRAVVAGRQVVAGGQDGKIRIWSRDTRAVTAELTGHGDMVTTVDVATDAVGEGWLLSGSVDRTARVWNLVTGEMTLVLTGHGAPVDDVALLDGSAVTVAADRTARFWSLVDGTPMFALPVQSALLSVTSCGRDRIAIGDRAGGVRIVDGFGEVVVETKAHDGAVFALAGDDRVVVSAGADATARLWDVRTGELRHTYRGHRGPVLSVALSDDAVATGSTDGTARVWNRGTGEQLTVMRGHHGGVPGCAFTRPTSGVGDPSAGQSLLTVSGSGEVRELVL